MFFCTLHTLIIQLPRSSSHQGQVHVQDKTREDLFYSAQFYRTFRLKLQRQLNTVQLRNKRKKEMWQKTKERVGIIQIAKANLVDDPYIRIQLQTTLGLYIYILFWKRWTFLYVRQVETKFSKRSILYLLFIRCSRRRTWTRFNLIPSLHVFRYECLALWPP